MDNEASVLNTLNELLKWIKASSYSNVESLLRNALPDSKSRLAYQLTDGTKSVKELLASAKIGQATLYTLYKRCTSMGLMEELPNGKRKRSFDLADFGLLPEDGDE